MTDTVNRKGKTPRALVLLSGGLDSTTCLALAVEEYGSAGVTALSVFYGQKHDREMEAAEAVARHYGTEHISMDLAPLFQFSDSALLRESGQAIPEASYEEQLKESGGAPVSTYVPFRNGLFLAAAASIALSKDCEAIFYGAHADDAAGNAYPDCSTAFNDAMNEAIWQGSGKMLRIRAPFVGKTKADVVAEGLKLGAPYQYTWSCYEGGDVPCGRCGTCLDRAEAFRKNGAADPALAYYARRANRL